MLLAGRWASGIEAAAEDAAHDVGEQQAHQRPCPSPRSARRQPWVDDVTA
jgi:hypothetical protein